MAEYSIQGETLTNIADALREALGEGEYTFIEQNVANIEIVYSEFVDEYNNGNITDGYSSDGEIVATSYGTNPYGELLPILHKSHEEKPDFTEGFWYVGTAVIDGVTYDKWRKIDIYPGTYFWDSIAKFYLYTNVIVTKGEGTRAISPVSMPQEILSVYEKGNSDGYNGGKNEAYGEIEHLNAELEQTLYGTDTGGKSFYDEFWDNFFVDTNFIGTFAGRGWNKSTFRPNRDLIITTQANYCFYFNGLNGDLVKWCEDLGINITIAPTNYTYMFAYSRFTRLPELDIRNAVNGNGLLMGCGQLVTVDKLRLKDDGSDTFRDTLLNCNALVNIEIEGIIGTSISFAQSTNLSKASITSIMEHLSTTATGQTLTLSKTAVNTAFETSAGAADGSTSAEWTAIVNAHKNWTISLI